MPSDYGLIIKKIIKAGMELGISEEKIMTIPYGNPPDYIKSDVADMWKDLSWESRAIAIISSYEKK